MEPGLTLNFEGTHNTANSATFPDCHSFPGYPHMPVPTFQPVKSLRLHRSGAPTNNPASGGALAVANLVGLSSSCALGRGPSLQSLPHLPSPTLTPLYAGGWAPSKRVLMHSQVTLRKWNDRPEVLESHLFDSS